MKDIRNKSIRPLRIPLPGGKILYLGPGKVAQISDKAAQQARVQKLAEEGSIEILAEGTAGTTGAQGATERERRFKG